MNKIVRKSIEAPVEKISGQDRVYKFIASDDKPDRMGDVIEVDGWDTSAWESNPVILWGHDKETPPIGKGIGVRKLGRPRQLQVDVLFADKSSHPLAGTIEALVRDGFVKATSVGFIPLDYEPLDKEDDSWFAPRRYKKQELLELSVVSVPANPRALIINNSLCTRSTPFVKGLVFSKENFTSVDEAFAWAAAHGYLNAKGKEEYRKNFYVKYHETDSPEDLLRVDLGNGVTALVESSEQAAVQKETNDMVVSDNLIKELVAAITAAKANEDIKAHNEMLIGLMKKNIESLDTLSSVVRELATLHDALKEAAPLPASGSNPAEVTAEEMELAIKALEAASRSIVTV